MNKACDCGAATVGLWADVHSPGCAIFGRDWSKVPVDKLRRVAAKMCRVLETLEDVLDKQTYEEFRRAEFDMPDDAELNVNLQARLIRDITKATNEADEAAPSVLSVTQ